MKVTDYNLTLILTGMILGLAGQFFNNMNVAKSNLGFGQRSWRYAAIINDCKVEKIFEEPGKSNNCEDDPYGETSPENVLSFLQG